MEGTPEQHKSSKGLVFSIVFASIVIGGSLVFFGSRYNAAPEMDSELAALLQEYKEAQDAQKPVRDITVSWDDAVDDDAFLGDKDAPVALVEFTDYQCYYCHRHFNETFPRLKSQYIDTGKLRYVVRDLPPSGHPLAYPAALAAECVREQKGDGGYFLIHNKLFGSDAFTSEDIQRFASETGVNMQTYNSCVSEDRFQSEIQNDLTDSDAFDVRGTPGFILTNGKKSKRISGAQDFSLFASEIDALLN